MYPEGVFAHFLVALFPWGEKYFLWLAFIALGATVCFVSACKPWGMLLLPQKAAVVLLAASWVPTVQSLRCSHRGESNLCAWPYLLNETGQTPRGPVKEGSSSSPRMFTVSAKESHGDLSFGMAQLWKVQCHGGEMPDGHNVLLSQETGRRDPFYGYIWKFGRLLFP